MSEVNFEEKLDQVVKVITSYANGAPLRDGAKRSARAQGKANWYVIRSYIQNARDEEELTPSYIAKASGLGIKAVVRAKARYPHLFAESKAKPEHEIPELDKLIKHLS